jgi:hypothetical protein
MTIHLCYRSHQEADRTVTDLPRVTLATRQRIPVLILGTMPNFEQIPMAKIESFWVEED